MKKIWKQWIQGVDFMMCFRKIYRLKRTSQRFARGLQHNSVLVRVCACIHRFFSFVQCTKGFQSSGDSKVSLNIRFQTIYSQICSEWVSALRYVRSFVWWPVWLWLAPLAARWSDLGPWFQPPPFRWCFARHFRNDCPRHPPLDAKNVYKVWVRKLWPFKECAYCTHWGWELPKKQTNKPSTDPGKQLLQWERKVVFDCVWSCMC